MKMNRTTTLMTALAFALSISACNKDKGAESPEDADDGPMEEAGEWTDEAAEDTADAFEEAGEEIEDAAEEVEDDLSDEPVEE